MAEPRRRRRLSKFPSSERFVKLDHVLLRSPAWLSLSSTAKALFLDLWRRHNEQFEGFDEYEKKLDRTPEVIVLEPAATAAGA